MSAPLPPASELVLAPADFSAGAVVSSQGESNTGGIATYVRLFKSGARLGSKPLGAAVSIALILKDASTAQYEYTAFDLAAKVKSTRQQFAREFAVEFTKGLKIGGRKLTKVEKLTVGPPTQIGPSGLILAVSAKMATGTVHLSLEMAQVDRVLNITELLGTWNTTVALADSRTALAAVQKRLTAAFTVANSAAPTISGTAVVGQTLTADAGSWNGAPSSFTYAWSRCDATGANCQPIAGATAATYQVSSADSGSTLVATATGTNSVGSASAASTPTAAVSS